jgi:hypothetical protein
MSRSPAKLASNIHLFMISIYRPCWTRISSNGRMDHMSILFTFFVIPTLPLSLAYIVKSSHGGVESRVYYSHPTIGESCSLKRHFASGIWPVERQTKFVFRKTASRGTISLLRAIFSSDWMTVANLYL